MFSHYPYVDELVATALGDGAERRVRRAYVCTHERLVPYPLQHNIHRLPRDVYARCLDGIRRAQQSPPRRDHFAGWLATVFGDGLVDVFMRPYNEKVWAHPLDTMAVEWQGERVPDVDVERILTNERADRDDAGWGPNAEFVFPRFGTGMLYERIAAALPRPVRLGTAATAIDPVARRISFSDGSDTDYDELLTTMPIPELVPRIDGCPDDVVAAARSLTSTSGIFVGVGVAGEAPPERCWLYFPDPEVPFYRVTYLSNYSPAMVPGPGLFSLLAEISVSRHRPFDVAHAGERTLDGLVAGGLLTPAQRRHDVVSTHVFTVPYSYPVPTLDRDVALAVVHGWLEPRGIRSRGRFGAWRYEIGNTDHSIMQGVELADRWLSGAPERTWASGTG
jgi:protoporphyrinogen oxidase